MNSDTESTERTESTVQSEPPGSARGDLRVRSVNLSYGTFEALRGIDLDVDAGSLTTILGPSGCGKTSLLRVIAGFVAPSCGTITVGERVLVDGKRSMPTEYRHVGIVPQEGALFPHLSVERNVTFGISRDPDRKQIAAEWLDRVGLAGFASARPHELSGGQQQRVALARALVAKPSLIVLDEPFSSLDTHLRQQVREQVVDIVRSTGTTAILVSHDREEALSVSDHVAVMINGRIAQSGSPTAIYAEPTTVSVASFVGELCILNGHIVGATAETVLGQHELRAASTKLAASAKQVVIACRPEQLHVTGGDDGTVVRHEFLGCQQRVRIRLRDASEVAVLVPGDLRLSTGSKVGIELRGTLLVLEPD